jgi:hypothetical protein
MSMVCSSRLTALASIVKSRPQQDRFRSTRCLTFQILFNKTYEELNLAKPSTSGRGVSLSSVKRAVNGTTLTRSVRGKLVRAVNACLAQQKKDAVDVLGLFGSNTQPKEEAAE